MSKNLGIMRFRDVEKVLEAALLNSGVRYELTSRSAAVAWRYRAYKFRTELRKLDEPVAIAQGRNPMTRFDELIIRLIPNDHECTGTLEIKFIEPQGKITPLGSAKESIEEKLDLAAKLLEDE